MPTGSSTPLTRGGKADVGVHTASRGQLVAVDIHGERQAYVVIGAGGGKWKNVSGGSYLAFALED